MESVEYFKIEMDNINGSHIYGQLARPKREGKFPAPLIVQWAGIYGFQGRNKSQTEYYAKSETWLKQLAKGEQGLAKRDLAVSDQQEGESE